MRQGLDAAEARLNRLLNLITETAVDVLGIDAATVTARYRADAVEHHQVAEDGYATICATDQRVVALDDVQYESGQGPCLAVLEPHEPILLRDIAQDPGRWEHYALTAAYLGVVSSMSVHIPTDEVAEMAASLNLYARNRWEITEQQVRAAEGFAEQLSATLIGVEGYRGAANLAEQMSEAMRSRAVIEQAKGIIIALTGSTPDEAFEVLRRRSQDANVKLRDTAKQLVAENIGPRGPG